MKSPRFEFEWNLISERWTVFKVEKRERHVKRICGCGWPLISSHSIVSDTNRIRTSKGNTKSRHFQMRFCARKHAVNMRTR